jgi:hypothetical protein
MVGTEYGVLPGGFRSESRLWPHHIMNICFGDVAADSIAGKG